MGIKIYPNPTNGKIYFNTDMKFLHGVQVQVLNSSGQVVLNRHVGTDPGVVDLSGNVCGIYYIRMTTDYGTKTEKVVLR